MAGKTLKKKSAGPKPAARKKATRHSSNTLFEQVASIPEIAVFSELPFAPKGTIGGKEVSAHHNKPGEEAPTAKPAAKATHARKKPAKKTATASKSKRKPK